MCVMKTMMLRRFVKVVVLGGLRMLVVICLVLGEMNCGVMTKASCDNENIGHRF
jgi:hypothetical protein